MNNAKVLWSPSAQRREGTQMNKFLHFVEKKYGLYFANYMELHQWSVDKSYDFWKELFSFYPVTFKGDLDPVCTQKTMDGPYGWFPGVHLNFAENLLSHRNSDSTALNFVHESGSKRKLSYKELAREVGRLQRPLGKLLNPGDVLACYMPNIPETVTSMLATTALGGVFTSLSCDFGAKESIGRLIQARPKVLVASLGYEYNGKYFSTIENIRLIQEEITSIKKIILVDFLNRHEKSPVIKNAVMWKDFVDEREDAVEFVSLPFSHPLYIMYSSGTTGRPKCIVHCAGGTLLQHIKELGLHTDLTQEKNIFFFTTCSWMMWHWLVSSLFFGSEITLYEGCPGFPDLDRYFSIIDREKINIFGTSPRFLGQLKKQVGTPSGDYSSLETILSTGAPLLPENFDFVYGSIKKDVHLASISGGTDIIGCFALGNPMGVVKRGLIQGPGLGMDVDCFDDRGSSIKNQKGELVCKKNFPSRPLYFLNDSEGKRFTQSYFGHYRGLWHHGDFIKITDSGGIRIYGRSDTVLNPGGVRIGTAEIYGAIEDLEFIEDSLCVGKKVSGDIDIYLFVKMKDGGQLNEANIKKLKSLIRKNATPRHVPQKIFAVDGIPYTRSGKKMELVVTRILGREQLPDIEGMANPECLGQYKQFA